MSSESIIIGLFFGVLGIIAFGFVYYSRKARTIAKHGSHDVLLADVERILQNKEGVIKK